MSDDLVRRLRFGSLTTMGSHRMNLEAADRIEELEAKLAKAVEGFEKLAYLGNGNVIVQRYIAELTGGKDE